VPLQAIAAIRSIQTDVGSSAIASMSAATPALPT
jgi:hypothetical protein